MVLAEVAPPPPLGVAGVAEAEVAVSLAGVPPLGVEEVALVVAEVPPLGLAAEPERGCLSSWSWSCWSWSCWRWLLALRAPAPLPRRQVAPCSLGRTLEPRVPRVALQGLTPPQVLHRVGVRGEEGPTTHI